MASPILSFFSSIFLSLPIFSIYLELGGVGGGPLVGLVRAVIVFLFFFPWSCFLCIDLVLPLVSVERRARWVRWVRWVRCGGWANELNWKSPSAPFLSERFAPSFVVWW